MAEPYCLAMVLCDAVHRDQATGKHTILGTFSVVNSLTYPAAIQMALYWAVTDAEGEVVVTVRMVDSKELFSDDVAPVFELEFPFSSPNPLAVIEVTTHVATLIPAPGVYHFELLVDDQVLMSRRLVAMKMNERGQEDENDEAE